MHLAIRTVDGGKVEIAELESSTVLEMVEAFGNPDISVLAFELDDGMVYLNKANIVRMDVD